jgi:hypothetical protein
MKALIVMCGITGALSLVACTKNEDVQPSAHSAQETERVTNRIDIPAAVRQNLAITFATVERRSVRQTMRFPGEFELPPESRREFRAMAPGRVNLHIKQLQRVESGTLLFTLDSPQWRDLQHEAVEAEGDIKVAQAALDVSLAQLEETTKSAVFVENRIDALRESDLRNVELESQLAELKNAIPRLQAEIVAKRVELNEADEHYRSRLNSLASLTGLNVEELLDASGGSAGSNAQPQAHWRTMNALEIKSDIAGVVESLDVTNGGWIETGGLAVTVVDPSSIRFRAQALQSDMSRLSDGQIAQIVLPQGGGFNVQDSVAATLTMGYRVSPEKRTIPLFAAPTSTPTWAKPGVSGFLEVFSDGGADSELAIPSSAVVRDGLVPIIFRRDPADPDKAIRMEADLGATDGRWVAVRSGVKQGDEIVLEGAYQLMLASSNASAKGGHFHADGTFHPDDHEE